MKNLLILVAFLAGSFNAVAAVRTSPVRGSSGTNATQQNASGNTTVSARAAVRGARSATTSNVAPATSGAGAGAVVQRRGAPASSGTTVGRSAIPVKTTAARAAKQNVVAGGTKVASAAQNTLVDETCRQKFDGCMDSFCMMENASGGRCLCSDRNKELNTLLAQIERLDAQSYKMATEGVEKIEMGENADAVMASAKAITKSLDGKSEEEDSKTKRRKLNLDAWKNVSVDEDSIFGEDDGEKRIEDQEGDALFAMSYDLCVAQMPECSSNFSMLGSLYRQRVRSDCTAFENSLKQKQTESQQKLAAAEAAMREAALEQYKSANKYDLGQCTIQFKQCMQTTAGCGEDFTGCAGLAAAEEAVTKKNTKSKKAKQTTIQGTVSSITIAAATFDTLESKKPLCMDVTKNCVNVRDQVWNTFLREVAPELKSAELLAESNLRTSCIGNIAKCFQKACKDNIDPNDEEGSYDMCLSRPETVESLCKVEITPCQAAEPKIMDYVRAKLASMRVDACTKEVKDCLQSEDRCGSDYSQCIGLDTDTIIGLCPQEKLTACYQEYGGKKSTVDDALATLVDGIFLNIDNSLLTQCQKAAQTKFLDICGDLNDCVTIQMENKIIGTESLASARRDKKTTISGLVNFNEIGMKQDTLSEAYPGVEYFNINSEKYSSCKDDKNAKNVLTGIENMVKRKFELLLSDPTVAMCVTGRDMRQITGKRSKRTEARFPHLLDSYSAVIVDSAVRAAQINYNNRYTELLLDAEGTAKSESEDYKNQIACNRMAMMDDFDEVTMESDPNNTGVKIDECKVEITSASGSKEMLEAMKQKNHTKRILTAKTSSALKEVNRKIDKKRAIEDSENMIGMVDVTAIYEPGAKVCRITTTTYACKGMTTISDSKSTNVGVSGGAGGINAGVDVGVSATTYKGSVCSSFTEPVISEQLITMGAGLAVKESNISRSNLQSEYIDNSVSEVGNGSSGPNFSLGLDMGGVANAVQGLSDKSKTEKQELKDSKKQGKKEARQMEKDLKKQQKEAKKQAKKDGKTGVDALSDESKDYIRNSMGL